MNRLIRILVVGFILCGNLVFSQSKKELQNKTVELKKEINKIEEYMKDLQVEEGNSMDQLKAIKRKVRLRESLIRNYRKEVNKFDSQIKENKEIVSSMEVDLVNLRTEYAKMIYYAYKNRSAHSKLMYIFSSDDFTQAYQRMKYLQQISSYRQKQAAIIQKTQIDIEKKIAAVIRKRISPRRKNNTDEHEIVGRCPILGILSDG